MTVMVPCENAHRAGLRRVIDEDDVKKVIDVLTGEVSDMPKNWNRRFKYNREKIKTGDVFELAEVVRNLAIREWEKGLSTGEKQMYTRAKKILASEFMYALDKDEEGAEEYLDGLLEERFGDKARRPPSAARRRDRDDRCRKATAVIAAAGSGERLGAEVPKALVEVAGRPMVAWSLDAFAEARRRRRDRGRRAAGPRGAGAGAGCRRRLGGRRRHRRRHPRGVGARGARGGRGRDRRVHDAARPLVDRRSCSTSWSPSSTSDPTPPA